VAASAAMIRDRRVADHPKTWQGGMQWEHDELMTVLCIPQSQIIGTKRTRLEYNNETVASNIEEGQCFLKQP